MIFGDYRDVTYRTRYPLNGRPKTVKVRYLSLATIGMTEPLSFKIKPTIGGYHIFRH